MTDRPAVRTVPNVELFTVGTWPASTGPVTWTYEHVASAIAAYDDPSYSLPVVKLGHDDPRFDGTPALGRIINPRASEDGRTCLGDLAGVPTWLADLIEGTFAYPRRSVEGIFGMSTPTGRHHEFALTAVSLLGVTAPAVSTLSDIATLYGIEPTEVAAAADTSRLEDRVPAPQPVAVAAAVSLDSIRDQFYASEACREKFGAWSWVVEVFTDLVMVNDDEGNLYSLPWSEAEGQRVQFDTDNAVAKMVEYVDRPDAPDEVAARVAASSGALRAATAAHMRRPTTTPTGPAPVAASGHTEHQEDTVDDSTLAGLRAAVGITDETADESTILAAVTEALSERADPPVITETAPVVPDGFTLVDAETLGTLQTAAARGVEAHTRFMLQDRDSTIRAAVGDGRIARAAVERYTERWNTEAAASGGDAPDTRALLAALPAGLVPVEAAGVAGDPVAVASEDATYASLFGKDA